MPGQERSLGLYSGTPSLAQPGLLRPPSSALAIRGDRWCQPERPLASLGESLGSYTCIQAVLGVTELGLQTPASDLPSVTVKPGSVFRCLFPALPSSPHSGFHSLQPFSVPQNVALGPEASKGAPVFPAPLGFKDQSNGGSREPEGAQKKLRAGSTICGHL